MHRTVVLSNFVILKTPTLKILQKTVFGFSLHRKNSDRYLTVYFRCLKY